MIESSIIIIIFEIANSSITEFMISEKKKPSNKVIHSVHHAKLTVWKGLPLNNTDNFGK